MPPWPHDYKKFRYKIVYSSSVYKPYHVGVLNLSAALLNQITYCFYPQNAPLHCLHSSAFVLASMSAALPVERKDMLLARFADSDFSTEVEAQAYDEETESTLGAEASQN